MPRPSKRKAAPSADVDLSATPASKKSRTKQTNKVDQLFDKYANKSIDLIDPAGIESLCSDLRVPHTDIKILMLAWTMQSEKQGYFSKDEWRRGLKCLGVDTLPKLKKAVIGLDKEVMKSGRFEDFYNFAFQYCLTEVRQRSVDIETICELLNIVLGPQFPAQLNLLIEYLKTQSDYRAINLDQWSSFYRFFKEVSFSDLQSYDSSQAWPVILDSFVDWLREREKIKLNFRSSRATDEPECACSKVSNCI